MNSESRDVSLAELVERAFKPDLLPGYLGIEPICVEGGRATLRLAFREVLKQNRGVIQGGVYATLLDVAMAWALISEIHPTPGTTVDLSINFLRPVEAGDLLAKAEIVRLGRSVAVLRGEITDSAQQAVAVGTGTFLLEGGLG